MIRILILTLLLLGGCASQAPLPVGTPDLQLPRQLHVQRVQAGQSQDWLLIIQQESGGLRWSMMDPLGIPQARQRLIDGQWQADGLLPPNPEARELFAALLFAMTPEHELPARYPSARQQGTLRRLDSRWQVEFRSPEVFSLTLAPARDQPVHFNISPLSNGITP
ncbi:hypothetical protein NJC38_10535 [Pseudomonas sp. 21LCFQ010]|uniref:hypothetical protein n=1 Tax=Pseudomonas sp. 21LCFQ010 TaxID=2957506 RepID=UPI002096B76E|nr:hypothetical protein [Pseudomonas sp. 21LCFQ010]MCO8162603.1 hypothetical protein [Pseudomonas sp. 21LCFQ010]